MVDVPCGSCHACCHGELVQLTPEEAKLYRTKTVEGHVVLDQTPDGTCVYLTTEGCSIHGHAPRVCREFDCRQYFLCMTRRERRVLLKESAKVDYHHKAVVLDEGRKRLASLPQDQRDIALADRTADSKRVRKQFEFKMLREIKP